MTYTIYWIYFYPWLRYYVAVMRITTQKYKKALQAHRQKISDAIASGVYASLMELTNKPPRPRYLSPARQQQLLKAYQSRVRNANSITKSWDDKMLIGSLGLSGKALTCLERSFVWGKSESRRMRLIDILDLLFTSRENANGKLCHSIPAIRITGTGPHTLKDLLDHLSNLDLGSEFDRELHLRKQQLKEFLKNSQQPEHQRVLKILESPRYIRTIPGRIKSDV